MIPICLLTIAKPDPQVVLARREVARYVYLRTGKLLGDDLGGIVVTTKASASHLDRPTLREIRSLRPQQYLLKKVGKKLLIVGGDGVGALYGAYRFAERLGVRFYLHGDTVPDKRIPFALPNLHEIGRPLFALRGIQPFHDFPEGPDWWNRDDYLAVVAQLPKMGMNFVGLHTYPEGDAGPEPTVWIGTPQDLDSKGRVLRSYPSTWANTKRDGAWGYKAMPTSAYSNGAASLFPTDDYGPDVMKGRMPKPKTPEQQNAQFDATAAMLHDAFSEARALGVKTCVGTETPLTIPREVRARLKAHGRNPADPTVLRELYRGIFEHIAKQYPTDYYWLWTPESWTWGGNTPEQLEQTIDDIRAAYGALEDTRRSQAHGLPKLATCGWVLGPQNDRAALDNALPKDVAMSCINRDLGHDPIDPAFARIHDRSKWAIPWMENDPTLTALQLWAGRMMVDAADAKRLGCDGLMGIHWRTKAMAPTVSALARAGWDQSWAKGRLVRYETEDRGKVAQFSERVEGTDEQDVYRTVRYSMPDYDLKVPNGEYEVTLKFNEPYHGDAGKRVFGVAIQGKTVIPSLDVFAKVGKNRALDYRFEGVRVDDGRLRITFQIQVENPCIAGIVARSGSFVKKVNCGGPAWNGYEADDKDLTAGARARTMPVTAFYTDFARANFGDEVAGEAGRLFASIDGTKLPNPSAWIAGPGGIRVESTPWPLVSPRYRFVDQFSALRQKVRGAGNLERFDYWLSMFRFQRAMAEVGCLRGALDAEVKSGDLPKARTTRTVLAKAWDRLMDHALEIVGTQGELGTVSNLESQARASQHILDAHDALLGGSAILSTSYRGAPRLIVPTVRSLASSGENLRIRAIVLGSDSTTRGALHWRTMGRGLWSISPLKHIGRSVYEATLPVRGTSVEYWIESNARSRRLRYPATAPALNQTVVVR